jgi:putative ABC transport system permease protein
MGPDGDAEEGQQIDLGSTKLTVVGTFLTGKVLLDNAVIVPMETISKIRGQTNSATVIAVRVERGASIAEVTRLLEERHPEISAVSTLEDLKKVDKGLEQLKTWQAVISIVATVIGLLFILLAMVMAVFERTREIGILRAVGWRKRRIVLVILIEATVIAVVGVVIGIPTGLLGVEVISKATDLSDFLLPSYELSLYLTALGVALSAALIGGLYPAWRASRLQPVEAIRYE